MFDPIVEGDYTEKVENIKKVGSLDFTDAVIVNNEGTSGSDVPVDTNNLDVEMLITDVPLQEENGYKLREIIFKETVGSSMMVKARVNKFYTEMVIDTAAQLTVISGDTARSSKLSWQDGEKVRLKGASKDSVLFGRLVKGVPITIGRKSYPWDVIVADITDGVILGLDFLLFYKAIVDLDMNCLLLNNEKIPAYIQQNEFGLKFGVNRVYIKHHLVVPPKTMVTSKCVIDGDLEGEVCISPFTESNKGLMIPHMLLSVIPEERVISITVRNHTDKYITLKKKHLIGMAIPAKIESSVENGSREFVSLYDV